MIRTCVVQAGGFQVESGAEEDLEHSELEDVEGNDEAEEDVDDGEGAWMTCQTLWMASHHAKVSV